MPSMENPYLSLNPFVTNEEHLRLLLLKVPDKYVKHSKVFHIEFECTSLHERLFCLLKEPSIDCMQTFCLKALSYGRPALAGLP
jgi:hypothetical protein